MVAVVPPEPLYLALQDTVEQYMALLQQEGVHVVHMELVLLRQVVEVVPQAVEVVPHLINVQAVVAAMAIVVEWIAAHVRIQEHIHATEVVATVIETTAVAVAVEVLAVPAVMFTHGLLLGTVNIIVVIIMLTIIAILVESLRVI